MYVENHIQSLSWLLLIINKGYIEVCDLLAVSPSYGNFKIVDG